MSRIDSASTEIEEEEIEVSKEFEEMVIRFVMYDDLIRKKQEELSELKKKRDPCKKLIIDTLEQLDETTIEINGGKLRRNRFESKTPVNVNLVKASLSKFIKNPDGVDKILEDIENSRPKKERIDIKRTFERPRKGNKAE